LFRVGDNAQCPVVLVESPEAIDPRVAVAAVADPVGDLTGKPASESKFCLYGAFKVSWIGSARALGQLSMRTMATASIPGVGKRAFMGRYPRSTDGLWFPSAWHPPHFDVKMKLCFFE